MTNAFTQQYHLANTIHQIKPQQITRHLFFGPLNTITQRQFLADNNIKFVIAVNLPTVRVADMVQHLGDFLVVNIDTDFALHNHTHEQAMAISEYNANNSSKLRQLVSHLTAALPPTMCQPVHRYSTNIIVDNIYDQFNDLITIFTASGLGNTLVFSPNGNDINIVTLLISHVITINHGVNMMEAMRYIKSLRPNVENISEESIMWNSGLCNYYEKFRFRDLQVKTAPRHVRRRDREDIEAGAPTKRNCA